MATYTPNDALTFAKTMVKSMPLSDTTVSYQMLDYVNGLIWTAAPWNWTLGSMAAVPLVAGTYDYTVTLPGDFARLEYAYLSDGKSPETPLRVDPWLPAPTVAGAVTKVSTQGNSSSWRVHPKPPAGYTPNLVTVYKKVPTKITAATYTSALTGLPDHYFWVYQLGVLWLAYHYADDVQRAGMAQLGANGAVVYTGMLGSFQAGLHQMRDAEKLTPALGAING